MRAHCPAGRRQPTSHHRPLPATASPALGVLEAQPPASPAMPHKLHSPPVHRQRHAHQRVSLPCRHALLSFVGMPSQPGAIKAPGLYGRCPLRHVRQLAIFPPEAPAPPPSTMFLQVRFPLPSRHPRPRGQADANPERVRARACCWSDATGMFSRTFLVSDACNPPPARTHAHTHHALLPRAHAAASPS